MTKGLKPTRLIADSSPVMKVPTAPAHLSRDAKTEWRRVAPILVERCILTIGDLGILESYCSAIGLVREASKHLQTEGLVLENGKRNPAAGIMTTAQTVALRAASELGLTPVARSRSGMSAQADPDDDTDNPLAVR
ncbi:phage terminase small subunit P27 family [Mameliella sp. AT18]|uniref:phage terminase small subunit P27 family n=1 Tax=Mameliella sp. AT18 TaxID=3028385 RepID=UPI00237B2F41|nr:phage terminase small subunit P27 family [Mameliella sp. AT18]MDD9730448.1 phage terminase small subunit P27 family [Mameliella sp. AT18]